MLYLASICFSKATANHSLFFQNGSEQRSILPKVPPVANKPVNKMRRKKERYCPADTDGKHKTRNTLYSKWMAQSQELHAVKAPPETISDTHLWPHLLLLSPAPLWSSLLCSSVRLLQRLQLCTGDAIPPEGSMVCFLPSFWSLLCHYPRPPLKLTSSTDLFPFSTLLLPKILKTSHLMYSINFTDLHVYHLSSFTGKEPPGRRESVAKLSK